MYVRILFILASFLGEARERSRLFLTATLYVALQKEEIIIFRIKDSPKFIENNLYNCYEYY